MDMIIHFLRARNRRATRPLRLHQITQILEPRRQGLTIEQS
jgi:hypothetical protein